MEITVTQLIDLYHEPFDKEFWATYKSLDSLLKDNMKWKELKTTVLKSKQISSNVLSLVNKEELDNAVQSLISSWDLKAEEARQKGIEIHNDHASQGHIANVWIEKPLELNYGCFTLKGRPDKVLIDNDSVIVVDTKTNEKISTKAAFNLNTKSSVKMYYPVSNLEDTVFNHYSLQLSFYAYMLETLYGYKVEKLLIDHITKNEELECKYLKSEVENILRDYNKKILLEQRRSKRREIVY